MSEEVFVTGQVKWFDTAKGFGFLQIPGGGLDIFCHANQLRKSGFLKCLVEGDKVKFVIEQGPKGAFATNISKIEG